MKLVKSVFRTPFDEKVYDPAEKLVEQFNGVRDNLAKMLPETADALDFIAEQIIAVRLTQDNVITEGSETKAIYHERRRGDYGSAVIREADKVMAETDRLLEETSGS